MVTDSAVSVFPDLASTSDIDIVPMQLDFDGETVPEGEVSRQRVLDTMRGNGAGRIRTSAPSPGAFLEAIKRSDAGDGVIVLTVSRKMSSSHESAVLASRMYGARVEVVDTGTAAGAEALVVLAAAQAARSGKELPEVLHQALEARDRVRLVAAVGDLRALGRSGRLPSPIASMASSVGVRPVFEFKKGSIRLLRPVRSPLAARDLLLSTWRSSLRGGDRLHVAAMHADDPAFANQLLQTVTQEHPAETAFVCRFGPVMLAHTGTDVVGLAWWWEPTG